MFKQLIISSLTIMFFVGAAKAQTGSIVIIGGEAIDQMLEEKKLSHPSDRTFKGYRLQIFQSSNRKDAMDAKTGFLRLFPEVPSYFVYQAPNFKIRVGDFRNKIEAQWLVEELSKNGYSSTFFVRERILYPRPIISE